MVILENLFTKSFKMTDPRKFYISKISQYTISQFGAIKVKIWKYFVVKKFFVGAEIHKKLSQILEQDTQE